MKKVILILGLFASIFTFAQDFVVTTGDGDPISNGEVFQFSTIEESDAALYFLIHNQSDQNLYFRAKGGELVNVPGNQVEFCFGELCLFNIVTGNYVPPMSGAYPNAITIAPGGTNSTFDKFWNKNTGDGENYPMIYEVILVQFDAPEDTEGAEVFSFVYEYSPTASTPDMTLQKLGVQLNNTLVDNELLFTTTSTMSMQIVDINGRSVATQSFEEGNNMYNASGLNAGIYIVKFTDQEGKNASIKIVKQ